MSGVFCQEGAIVAGAMLFNKTSVDRGTNLYIGLFTNSSGLSNTTTFASIISANLTGYAAIQLTDTLWTQAASGGTSTWTNTGAPVTFSCTGVTTGNLAVYGYFIYSATALGATNSRLLGYEIDSGLGGSGALFVPGNSYVITPSIAIV